MKVSRHERAIRDEIVRVHNELQTQRKHADEATQRVRCLVEQRELLERLLNTADSMSSKTSPAKGE